MKLENISFNVEACSSMSFNEFKKMFEPLVTKKKLTIEEIYFEVTGRKPEPDERQIKIDEPLETQEETFSEITERKKRNKKSIDKESPSE